MILLLSRRLIAAATAAATATAAAANAVTAAAVPTALEVSCKNKQLLFYSHIRGRYWPVKIDDVSL